MLLQISDNETLTILIIYYDNISHDEFKSTSLVLFKLIKFIKIID
jgi:hypothetical protein